MEQLAVLNVVLSLLKIVFLIAGTLYFVKHLNK